MVIFRLIEDHRNRFDVGGMEATRVASQAARVIPLTRHQEQLKNTGQWAATLFDMTR
jgi:hypothetical protein